MSQAVIGEIAQTEFVSRVFMMRSATSVRLSSVGGTDVARMA